MSYRSDVKYILLFENNDDYSKFLGEATLMCGSNPEMADVLEAVSKQDYEVDSPYPIQVRVQWDHVKWYDDTEWVSLQEDLMEAAHRHGGAYYFVRVGEDVNDIQTREHESKYSCCLSEFIYTRTTTHFE